MRSKPFIFSLIVIVLASCTPEDGIDGLNGIDGLDGIDGTSIGILVEENNGCKTISFYRDENNNSNYDNELILTSVTLCDGEDGADGTNGVDGADGTDGLDGISVGVFIEQLENDCQRLFFFEDNNRNNLKDEGEETLSSMQLCNGADGSDGTNGSNGNDGLSYVFVFSNALSSVCSQGGVSIDVYYDNDANGAYSSVDTLFQTTTHCFSQTSGSPKFYLDTNGYTVKCPNAEIGEKGILNGKEYIAVDSDLLNTLFDGGYDPSCLCTTKVTHTEDLYDGSIYSSGAVKDDDYDISNWDTSNVLSFKNFLSGGVPSDFNQNISKWDVSNAYNFSYMLSGLPATFNRDISDWDVSNGKIFAGMFSSSISFNQDISGWDMGNAVDLRYMFGGAMSFNQNIGSWDTSNVLIMEGMFNGAQSIFNQDISEWDTSKVTNMAGMFFQNSSFNQNISKWDTSKVTSMNQMFISATSFNQDLSSWNVSAVSDCQDFSLLASSWTLPKPNFTNCTP